MPKSITAFQCTHCKDLIESTERYLEVAKLVAVQKGSTNDNQWKKDNQNLMSLEDTVFCDETCLSDFVLDQLKFKP